MTRLTRLLRALLDRLRRRRPDYADPASDDEHEIVPLYLPVCEHCGRDVALADDDETWEHVK